MNKPETSEFLEKCTEQIEGSYEFMLAYAAQGRDVEDRSGKGPGSIREFLDDLVDGMANIVYAVAEQMETLEEDHSAFNALEDFKHVLSEDVESALKAVKLVLSLPNINSQIIDNLNASVHLRCLLTDIFLIDEALSIHQHHGQVVKEE